MWCNFRISICSKNIYHQTISHKNASLCSCCNIVQSSTTSTLVHQWVPKPPLDNIKTSKKYKKVICIIVIITRQNWAKNDNDNCVLVLKNSMISSVGLNFLEFLWAVCYSFEESNYLVVSKAETCSSQTTIIFLWC